MQRGRSTLNSFPEPFDLNQGSLSENTSMDHSVENQQSNYILGSTDGNVSRVSTTDGSSQRFSVWDQGESSSSSNNMQGSFPPSNATGYRNLVTGRPPAMQNLSSNNASMNLNLNDGQPWNHDCHQGSGAVASHNLYKSGHSAVEQNSTFYASSSNIGTFSGRSSNSSENYDLAGPSFGSWGSSCKFELESANGKEHNAASSSW